MGTVTSLKRRMASIARWMMVLEDGLNGHPHALGDGESMAFKKQYIGLYVLEQLTPATTGDAT